MAYIVPIICSIIAVGQAYKCGDLSHVGRHATAVGPTSKSKRDTYPWNVLIKRPGMAPHCLGTLITKFEDSPTINNTDLVITATSCFESKIPFLDALTTYSALVGLSRVGSVKPNAVSVKIKSIAKYGDKSGTKSMRQGVSIATLKYKVVFSENVRPVCVAKDRPKTYSECYLTLYDKSAQTVSQHLVEPLSYRYCRTLGRQLMQTNGICAIYKKRKNIEVHGSPLLCVTDDIVFQFGVLTDVFKRSADEAKERIAHFSSLNLISNFTSVEHISQDVQPNNSAALNLSTVVRRRGTFKGNDLSRVSTVLEKPARPHSLIGSAMRDEPLHAHMESITASVETVTRRRNATITKPPRLHRNTIIVNV